MASSVTARPNAHFWQLARSARARCLPRKTKNGWRLFKSWRLSERAENAQNIKIAFCIQTRTLKNTTEYDLAICIAKISSYTQPDFLLNYARLCQRDYLRVIGTCFDFWLDSLLSLMKIIIPAPIISETPGNNVEIGASLKTSHPNIKERGIPKYSKIDKLDGSANR